MRRIFATTTGLLLLSGLTFATTPAIATETSLSNYSVSATPDRSPATVILSTAQRENLTVGAQILAGKQQTSEVTNKSAQDSHREGLGHSSVRRNILLFAGIAIVFFVARCSIRRAKDDN